MPIFMRKEASVKYLAAAIDCEGSQLENADLEVIIYDNKVAGIILTSVDEEFSNEIYEFTKDLILKIQVKMLRGKVGKVLKI